MKGFRYALIPLIFLLAAGTANATTIASNDPKVVIETTINHMIDVLEARKDKTRVTPEDRDRIRDIVTGIFDYETMAKRCLGETWKTIDPAERKHFVDTFRVLLEMTYGNRLSNYHGQTVTYDNAELKGDKARVMSTVTDGTKKTPVEYSLRQTPTGWQVYDIRIEGASLIRTFYEDFQSSLEKGSYQDLVKSIENRIADLKAKDKS